METINKGQSWPLYEQPMLMLKAMWTGEVAPFGCGYTCAIGDTVTAGVVGAPCGMCCQAALRYMQAAVLHCHANPKLPARACVA